MKRLICLMLVLMTLLPCALAQESIADTDPNIYSGYWLDAWSSRAHMTITFDGSRHKAVIHWAESAFAHVEWIITGLIENGRLTSSDCVKRYVSFDEAGVRDETVLYENEPASLALENGAFVWTDIEGQGANCRFERYDEIDLRDVYNPEHYAHLYVTDVYSTADGSITYWQGTLGTIHENGTLSGFDLRDALTLPLADNASVLLPADLTDPVGCYVLFDMNEQGTLTEIAYNEDQPEAPLPLPVEPEDVLIVPAPPTAR